MSEIRTSSRKTRVGKGVPDTMEQTVVVVSVVRVALPVCKKHIKT